MDLFLIVLTSLKRYPESPWSPRFVLRSPWSPRSHLFRTRRGPQLRTDKIFILFYPIRDVNYISPAICARVPKKIPKKFLLLRN